MSDDLGDDPFTPGPSVPGASGGGRLPRGGRGDGGEPAGGPAGGEPAVPADAVAARAKRRAPLRLGPMVVSGEIDNTRPYAVCGWLKLRGQEHPLTLNLTGDAGENLRGKRVRFEPGAGGTSLLNQQFVPPSLSDKLAWQQIGPTGPMTLAGGAGGSRKLRLEWDSQNGRVLLDLPAASVTPLPDRDLEDELDDELDALLADDGEDDDDLPWDDDDLGGGLIGSGGALFDDEDDDPFGLFPADLQDRLDDEADDLDKEVIPGYDGSTYDLDGPDLPGFGDDLDEDGGGTFAADLRRLEELIEGGAGVPIGQVFDPPLRLRPSAQLNDVRVEAALKLLLARLAEHGIALDICEHYTPRQSYEYLLAEICPSELTHPELDPVRWVQHFSTSDCCEACDEEFEREFEEYERHRRRDDDED